MTSPEPGGSLLAHIQRLQEMMQRMDAAQKADEEWLLQVDARLNERLADSEAELAALQEESDRRQAEREAEREQQRAEWERQRAEWERQRAEWEQQRQETNQRIEALRSRSEERYRAHQEEMLAYKERADRHHESIQALLDGLVQAQADIARLEAAS